MYHDTYDALGRQKHIENMRSFGVPVVVALNRFATDTDAEIRYIRDFCAESGVSYAFADVFAKGGAGGTELAQAVCDTIEKQEGRSSGLTLIPQLGSHHTPEFIFR